MIKRFQKSCKFVPSFLDNFNAYVPLQHRDEVQSVEDQTGVENNLIFENQQNEGICTCVIFTKTRKKCVCRF